MRMRFKPYAHDELMAADFHVHEPLIWGGKWHAQYARPEQPFVLELGCGKGGIYNFVTKRGLCKGARSKLSWTQVETKFPIRFAFCARKTFWKSSAFWLN